MICISMCDYIYFESQNFCPRISRYVRRKKNVKDIQSSFIYGFKNQISTGIPCHYKSIIIFSSSEKMSDNQQVGVEYLVPTTQAWHHILNKTACYVCQYNMSYFNISFHHLFHVEPKFTVRPHKRKYFFLTGYVYSRTVKK